MHPGQMPAEVLADLQQICAATTASSGSPRSCRLHPVAGTGDAHKGAGEPCRCPSSAEPAHLLCDEGYLDIVAALGLLVVLSPLLLIAGTIAPIDLSLPVFFWQQLLGAGSRGFMLYKFRTFGPPSTSATS